MFDAYPFVNMILPEARGLDPAPYLANAATVLDRLDHRPEGRPHVTEDGSSVRGYRYAIRVTPEEDGDYGPAVRLEVTTLDGGAPDEETAASLLSDTVMLALDHSQADVLEWYAQGTMIDRADFLRLRGNTAPMHLQGEIEALYGDGQQRDVTRGIRDALYGQDASPPPIGQTTDRLSRYRIGAAAAAPQAAPARADKGVSALSTPWTALRETLSFLRGMDFRLVSQVVAVTMLFVVLVNTDRLEFVLQRVLH